MLKKEIRKVLLETKEKKKNLLVEQQIIKERFMMIVETTNNIEKFDKLPKLRKQEICFSLLKEYNSLRNFGIISEQLDFMSILNSLFGNLFGSSAAETISEPIVNKVLTFLGFKPGSVITKTMVSILTSNPTELGKALTDCRLMTKLLIDSFSEGLIMVLQDQIKQDGYFFNYLRNYLGGLMKNSVLENEISDKVCGIFDSFTENAKTVKDKLTGGSSTDSSSGGESLASKIKGFFGR